MKHQHKKNTLILNNFFSIRKLKFGVASITLGSALIIGAHHEAQAAENNNSQGTQNSTTIDKTNKNTNQSAQQEQSKPVETVATQNSNTQNNQATTQNAPTTNTNNSNSKSNELSQTLNFQVQKDKTNDVSHMDQYVQHPGKVIKKDNKYYFQITLDNASWWKSFRFFDENETELPTTIVDDNTEKDTKTVNMEVTPGMNNIISKVHIVIPALKYDHEYTTHIELESVIPTIEDPEPTATKNQAKQNDTTNVEQPDADKKQDTAKKPSAQISGTDTEKGNKTYKDSNDPKPKKEQKHDKDSKEAKGKDSVVKDNSKSKTSKELPETGSKQEPNSNSLVFSLIALLSSLFLLKRKNNKNI